MVSTRSIKKVSFNFRPGRCIGPQYEVVSLLGSGSEGEVYKILERETGIHRAAKFYYPNMEPHDRAVVWYAQKLNHLRSCPIVLQYHHTQAIQVARKRVLCLISDFCEGVQLEQWLLQQKGHRAPPFTALNVLYRLVQGLELVHGVGEYHGDVHSQNILLRPRGISFELKLVDFFNWGPPAKHKKQQDILDAVRVFYECLGGRRYYREQAPQIKYICSALRRDLLFERFPTMSALRVYLESFEWISL